MRVGKLETSCCNYNWGCADWHSLTFVQFPFRASCFYHLSKNARRLMAVPKRLEGSVLFIEIKAFGGEIADNVWIMLHLFTTYENILLPLTWFAIQINHFMLYMKILFSHLLPLHLSKQILQCLCICLVYVCTRKHKLYNLCFKVGLFAPFTGRFYRCVRCPTAYHVGDFCIAAGSVNLAGSHIVCSDHFQPNRSLSCHSRINITWCFSCSKGEHIFVFQ